MGPKWEQLLDKMSTLLRKYSTGSTEMTQELLTYMNSSSVSDGSVATTNMSQLRKMPLPCMTSGWLPIPTRMVTSPSMKSMPTKKLMDSSEVFDPNNNFVRNSVSEL